MHISILETQLEAALCPSLWPKGIMCDLAWENPGKTSKPIWGTNEDMHTQFLVDSPFSQVFVGNCDLGSNASMVEKFVLSECSTLCHSVEELPNTDRRGNKCYKLTIPRENSAEVLKREHWPEGVSISRYRTQKLSSSVLQTPLPQCEKIGPKPMQSS